MNEINQAINPSGMAMLPEEAVDGSGHNAIYLYMAYNNNSNQAWKIAGGLNGG